MSSSQPKAHYLNDVFARVKRVLRFALLFSLASNLLMLALPLYSLQVLDRVLSSRSYDTLLVLSFIAICAFVFFGLFQAVRQFIATRIGEWIDAKVAPDIFERSIRLAAQQQGTQGSQNMRDLATIKGFLTGPGFQTVMDAPWAPLFLLIVFLINPVLGTVTIVGAILLFFLALMTEFATKKDTMQAQQENLHCLQINDTAIRNAEAIEAMGMMPGLRSSWQTSNQRVKQLQGQAANRYNLITAASKSLRMLIQIGIMGAGAIMALNNQLSIGGMIAASILTGRALAPFDAAITIWKNILAARDAYQRLNTSLSAQTIHRGTLNLPAPNGALAVENVLFRPPGRDHLVLRSVSFQLHPGDTMGLIGASAAGKSTLGKLLVGIWPATSGHIRLDGVDVYKWNREDVGQYIGYLPQEVDLFEGTIKDNIARMQSDAPMNKVIDAAKMAQVHEFILEFPDGYETVVGSGLVTFSPGQKQRIALARALYGTPKLLVLDEPNSNLDGDGEQALIRALEAAKAQHITTIVIAHKPSLVNHLEKVLVLREGRVEIFGPRDDVLKRYVRPVQNKGGEHAA